MSHQVVPIRVYAATFAILLVLTLTTFLLAQIDFGRMNTVIALVIAVTKALLVALFFMHIRYSPRLMKLVFAASLFWLFIMIAIMMSDYLTRAGLRYPGNP
jgi:cytochrome c oxidase subunit 4